ncbi:MAG TPA: glycosyltransferase family 1 protein [Patescibacteria group bacterium]|nr:glycosyltransferase family 1 protein [Patescibacteria group bacterium]
MRIFIDARHLTRPQQSGVGEYTTRLFSAWLSLPCEHTFVFFSSGRKPAQDILSASTPTSESPHFRHLAVPNKLLNASLTTLRRPRLDAWIEHGLPSSPDSTVFFFPNLAIASVRPQMPYVLTIHDLSFELFPHHLDLKSRLWHAAVRPKTLARGACAILVPSQATAWDVERLYGVPTERIHVIAHGYTEIFHPQQTKMDNRVQALYRLPQRFALFVGTLEPRKNIRMMIEALSDYRKYTGDSLPLVLAGKSTRSFNAIPSEEKKETIALGYVPSEHRPSLYRLATTTLFPSLYEGFGLPALESMACGTPVITSRTSSMPEVVGNAAISIDPHSRNDLVSALEHLMGSPILRQTLIERGLKRVENFSWEQCALKTMKVLEMVSKR